MTCGFHNILHSFQFFRHNKYFKFQENPIEQKIKALEFTIKIK